MPQENPKDPGNKTTKTDTYKRFSHERPDPTTNPPVIQPISLTPPSKTPKPEPKPKPNNSDSDK